MKKHFYLIGSLRNEYVPELDKAIRTGCSNIEPFAEWYGAGKLADDAFKEYHKGLGRSFRDALKSAAGRHIFEFDKYHLDRCDGAVLVMPSGKSCHLEAGYMVGRGKPVFMLYPDGEPEERYELMAQFLTEIFYSESELIEGLNKYTDPNKYSKIVPSQQAQECLAEIKRIVPRYSIDVV